MSSLMDLVLEKLEPHEKIDLMTVLSLPTTVKFNILIAVAKDVFLSSCIHVFHFGCEKKHYLPFINFEVFDKEIEWLDSTLSFEDFNLFLFVFIKMCKCDNTTDQMVGHLLQCMLLLRLVPSAREKMNVQTDQTLESRVCYVNTIFDDHSEFLKELSCNEWFVKIERGFEPLKIPNLSLDGTKIKNIDLENEIKAAVARRKTLQRAGVSRFSPRLNVFSDFPTFPLVYFAPRENPA